MNLKNQKYHFIYLLIISLIFTNCGEEENNEVFQNFYFDKNNSGLRSNEVFHENNLITIEEIENKFDSNRKFSIQSIEKKKEDLTFRAKKIPNELYLQNQGLSEQELNLALEDVNKEQLFYFEIEEHQKQDVIKKYFNENLDQNISYLSFDIYNDFFIINSNGDTIPAAYSLYERNYHVAPFERLILSFNGVEFDDEIQLIYRDQLFGKGESTFNFAPEKKISQNTNQPS